MQRTFKKFQLKIFCYKLKKVIDKLYLIVIK